MTSKSTQNTLERLASLIRGESRQALIEYGLQPVQLEVLRYLAQCNRYSDTPMGVTDFLGQTKGTVSQTLKVLEREGLIQKVADRNDRRVSHLKISAKGKKLIDKIYPSKILMQGLSALPENQQLLISEQLSDLLKAVQAGNHFKAFGQCASCIHNRKKQGAYWCGLTEEALSQEETQLICREYQGTSA